MITEKNTTSSTIGSSFSSSISFNFDPMTRRRNPNTFNDARDLTGMTRNTKSLKKIAFIQGRPICDFLSNFQWEM